MFPILLLSMLSFTPLPGATDYLVYYSLDPANVASGAFYACQEPICHDPLPDPLPGTVRYYSVVGRDEHGEGPH